MSNDEVAVPIDGAEEANSLTEALTVAPSGAQPEFPLAAAFLVQAYADPRNPGNVDLRLMNYKCSPEILEQLLYMTLQGVVQARADAEARDKSVKIYSANDPLPSMDDFRNVKIH